MSIDFNRAAMLLHVCSKSLPYPPLRALHDAAMAELVEMQKPQEDRSLWYSLPRSVDALPPTTGDR